MQGIENRAKDIEYRIPSSREQIQPMVSTMGVIIKYRKKQPF